MQKRIIALALAILTLTGVCACFSGCAGSTDDGAYITMYLTDEIYDFDPANVYYDTDTYHVVSLLFSTLFTLDSNGKVQKNLVKEYNFYDNDAKDEHKLVMTLADYAYWSNGDRITADDVVFAWKRIMNWESSYESASLLYDLKNARAVKNGNLSIDKLGVKATGDYEVTVEFESRVDQSAFLLNMTSLALAPLKESDVNEKGEQYDDWAKIQGFYTSGPFKLAKSVYLDCSKLDDQTGVKSYYDSNAYTSSGSTSAKFYSESRLQYFILERNLYYFRDAENDAVNKSVTPYRILCDCTKTPEEIMAAYQNGDIFYVGEIPFSVRNNSAYADILKNARVTDALATYILALNENKTILYSTLEKNDAGSVKLYNKGGSELKYEILNIAENKNGETVVELTQNGRTTQYTKIYDKDHNEIAFDKDGLKVGTCLFANTAVREALSLAIDRESIAQAVVYAEAATGLVSTGVMESTSAKTTFRSAAGDILAKTADLTAAKAKLTEAGINPGDYGFTLTVNALDDAQVAIGHMIAEMWGVNGLGFHVTVYELGAVANNDYYATTQSTPTDFADNLFIEAIQNANYDVIGYDYVAYSASAFNQLAPFATAFSGNGIATTATVVEDRLIPEYTYSELGHKTGYSSEAYDLLIEAAWYLASYNSITVEDYADYGYADRAVKESEREADGKAKFAAMLTSLQTVYDTYNINTENNLASGKATLLREAEKLLLADMPVIPVIFEKNAVLVSNQLSDVRSDYFTPAVFTKTNLKNYTQYVAKFSLFPNME